MTSKKQGSSKLRQDDSMDFEQQQPYRQHYQDEYDEDDISQYIDTEEDEGKEQRLVVRIVPKAIDYIIFGIQLAVLGSYFYVAYCWGDFGQTECRADSNSNEPLSSASINQTAVDVGSYFCIAIRWGFWMSFLTFLRAILAQVGLCLKKWVLLWCSYVLFAANISISIVLFILMQVWRWSHSGRVCSGDFLDDSDSADRDVYLIFEGRFIKIMLIIVYSILGMSCFSIMIVSICIYKRHKKEEQEEKGDESIVSALRGRDSAFTKALDPDYEAAMRESSKSELDKKFFPENEAKSDSQQLIKA